MQIMNRSVLPSNVYERPTEQKPILFILEDLHWTADPSTLELLDLLIDQIPSITICLSRK